jgi:hypothetical protein
LLAAGLLAASACATRPNGGEVSELVFPDEATFVSAGVSEFVGRRCGALDCHGNVARPLRLYGDKGLRFDIASDLPRDTRPTTAEEHRANYRSIIGLEPEDLSRSVASGGRYVDFLLFEKPLDDEGGGVRHKGGRVLRRSPSDPGWVCLHGWIAGAPDPASCAAATF